MYFVREIPTWRVRLVLRAIQTSRMSATNFWQHLERKLWGFEIPAPRRCE